MSSEAKLRPPEPAPQFTGLNPVRDVLPNGLVVLARQTSRTPAVTLNLAVRAGAASDSPEAIGSMHLLARTIDRGTKTRSGERIAAEFDDRGVSLNINVTRHQTFLTCTCLTPDFAAVMAVLADIVRNPIIPEAELLLRKREIVTSIKQDEDNPLVRASEALMALLYGGSHPYGRRVKGSIESVEALGREQLLALHAARFTPGAATLAIVGDVDPRLAIEIANRAFDGWPPVTLPLDAWPKATRAVERRQRVLAMPNKAQADVAYGFVGIARSDPAYFAYFLMNNVLGQYALGGRLGDSIRERQGMAYYVSSALEANLCPGPLVIRAGVAPANVDRTIASIDDELRKLTREGMSATELQESKQFLIGAMPRTLETNAGIANFLQTSEFFGLGLDFDLRLPDLFRAVTLDQANDAARALLEPDRATIVVAGPYPPVASA
jgi:zinc protease